MGEKHVVGIYTIHHFFLRRGPQWGAEMRGTKFRDEAIGGFRTFWGLLGSKHCMLAWSSRILVLVGGGEGQDHSYYPVFKSFLKIKFFAVFGLQNSHFEFHNTQLKKVILY